MNLRPLFYLSLFLLAGCLTGCDDIIEPSLSKKQVIPEAPAPQYQSSGYTVNFWWDPVEHATSYHLQVVTPTFAAPGSLVLDTIVNSYKFAYTLTPGSYQWRVMAQNGSSQTGYTAPRSFSVASSPINQQAVLLSSPASGFVSNDNSITYQWTSLYGATQYRFEIDTNNFADESNIVSNKVVPGQQTTFSFPKDKVYQWRVRAENDSVRSLWSIINVVTYDHTPPVQVITISPADGTTKSQPILLQWNPVPTAASYKLYIYKSDGTTLYSSSFPLSINTVSYSFKEGNPGDKFYWKVTAVDSAGNEGEASQLISFIEQ